MGIVIVLYIVFSCVLIRMDGVSSLFARGSLYKMFIQTLSLGIYESTCKLKKKNTPN